MVEDLPTVLEFRALNGSPLHSIPLSDWGMPAPVKGEHVYIGGVGYNVERRCFSFKYRGFVPGKEEDTWTPKESKVIIILYPLEFLPPSF